MEDSGALVFWDCVHLEIQKKRALLVIRDLYEFQVQPADIDIIEGTEYVAIVWSNTAPCAW